MNPKEKDNYGWNCLHITAANNALDIVKYLITEQNMDPKDKDNFGNDILDIATHESAYNVIKYIIENCKMRILSSKLYIENIQNLFTQDARLFLSNIEQKVIQESLIQATPDSCLICFGNITAESGTITDWGCLSIICKECKDKMLDSQGVNNPKCPNCRRKMAK